MAKAAKKASDSSKSYTVLSPFRDLHDYDKIYEVDEELSDLEEERAKTLIALKLVKDNSAQDANPDAEAAAKAKADAEAKAKADAEAAKNK